MPSYWLSFAGATGKARVYIIDAANEIVARVKAHVLKLYRPGDELLMFELENNATEQALPRNVQLTEEELATVDAVNLGDVDPELN